MKNLIFLSAVLAAFILGCDNNNGENEPSITILQPADGDMVTGSFDINVDASGGDIVHAYLDSEWCGTGNPAGAVSCNSAVAANGEHQLKVDLATAAEDAIASDTIVVEVSN